MHDILLSQLLGVMFGLCVVAFALQARVFLLLRRRHPEVYQAIPQPALAADGDNEDNSGAIRFFWRFMLHHRYLALNDSELTLICHALLAVSAGFVLAFIIALFSLAGSLR